MSGRGIIVVKKKTDFELWQLGLNLSFTNFLIEYHKGSNFIKSQFYYKINYTSIYYKYYNI